VGARRDIRFDAFNAPAINLPVGSTGRCNTGVKSLHYCSAQQSDAKVVAEFHLHARILRR
jgi:hypothetical protein